MRFALLGAAGYVAPRHMKAIHDLGHELVAACDPHDSVGVLDQYAPGCEFFTDGGEFWHWVGNHGVDAVSICTPNDLHGRQIHTAVHKVPLVVCEKPMALTARELDTLQGFEQVTGSRVATILQLRRHTNTNLLRGLDLEGAVISVTYTSPRGPWYYKSWKGDPDRSGGILMNIGVHLFDLLIHLFGEPKLWGTHRLTRDQAEGMVEFDSQWVEWRLSTRPEDGTNRVIEYTRPDGTDKSLSFTGGFNNLHTEAYREIVNGGGPGIEEARRSIQLVNRLQEAAKDEAVAYMPKFTYVHPTASIGEGTVIWRFSQVREGAKVGHGCTVGMSVSIGKNAVIGDRVRVQNHADIFEGVTLEDDVFIGPGVTFTNVRRPAPGEDRMDGLKETIVRKGAVIGAGATILPGVEIGEGAFVGAGSVVTRDVPAGRLVYGNPGEDHGPCLT